ncbi:MAG: sigma-54-dependent Fis family transcriptional regulator [Syntrophaceae bacterium]|nr:sigma-54-dependent Fis family transcriptional regulator [Syntrophaceae bacterium]
MHRILIVDDELNMRLVLQAMLRKEGLDVLLAADGLEALKVLKREEVSAVITDLKMPKLDGMALLDAIRQDQPALPVIMITAYGTIATAVDALKKGAFDYITKPFEQDEIKNVIRKAIQTKTLDDSEIVPGPGEMDHGGIVGRGEAMMELFETIRCVAPTTTTVLITGETGTGKELAAQAVHLNSPRKANPFLKINCAAIPENLMESELFGYEKGAFTGAVMSKPGRFELAHKGTLFLDEIGELSRDMQVKILRVIQEQEFERVGGLRTIKVDVRLIAATNRNLQQEVKEGRFREDLYYRLNVFPIWIPPLRERREDMPALVDFFIQKFNRKFERAVQGADRELLEIFRRYDWPGNVREMENVLERLVLMASKDSLTADNLPPELKAAVQEAVLSGRGDQREPIKKLIKEHSEEIERQMILSVLESCGYNVTRAAQELGMSRKGLQLKMIKYNLRKGS